MNHLDLMIVAMAANIIERESFSNKIDGEASYHMSNIASGVKIFINRYAYLMDDISFANTLYMLDSDKGELIKKLHGEADE